MRSLADRRPVVAAVILWALLLTVMQGLTVATSDVRVRAWPVWVLLVAVLYSGLAIWFVSRIPAKKTSASPAAMRFAIAPMMIAVGLAFQGAPLWSLWLTLAAVGLLLAEAVVLTVRDPERPAATNAP